MWTASIALQVELEQNPNVTERHNSLALLAAATAFVFPTQLTIRRAANVERSGLRGLDSLHYAIAEEQAVEWLVTTDDRFLRFASRNFSAGPLQLINPVDLLQRRFPWLLPPKA